MPGFGHIDVYGYFEALECWVFCGWASHEAQATLKGDDFVVRFASVEVRGSAVLTFYPREDVGEWGLGVVVFFPGERWSNARLMFLRAASAPDLQLPATPDSHEIGRDEIKSIINPILAASRPALPQTIRRMLLSQAVGVTEPPSSTDEAPRPSDALAPPGGQKSPPRMEGPPRSPAVWPQGSVLVDFEEAIFCPPRGVVLVGWCLRRPGTSLQIAMRSGNDVTPLDFSSSVWFSRPDVRATIGCKHGFEEDRCGFIVFFPDGYSPDGQSELEVTVEGSAPVYRLVPDPRLHGLPAIRSLLSRLDIQDANVSATFDRGLGEAVHRLNAERLSEGGRIAQITFGAETVSPAASIIITLNRRLDFAELQCAAFADSPYVWGCEIIYVLTDPSLRQEAKRLLASISARFDLRLKLLVFGRGGGVAPACNAGLAAARGARVCFMRSEVIPTETHWLAPLVDRIDNDLTIGVVSPLLLHEDGSVHHQGWAFQSVPRCSGWYRPDPVGRGLRPGPDTGLSVVLAVSGACMVLNTERLRGVGGFDERYILEGFEDSDLCLRLKAHGYASCVDLNVRMATLGQTSPTPATERWRDNLHCYNNWAHQDRWGDFIAVELGRSDEPPR